MEYMEFVENSFDEGLKRIRTAKTERVRNNRYCEMLKLKQRFKEMHPELTDEIDSLWATYSKRMLKAAASV